MTHKEEIMKKFTSVLIVLALVLTMSVGVFASNTYANEAAANAANVAAGTKITVAGVEYTAIDDALKIKEDPEGSYYLLKDITWPAETLGIFKGSLNGGNHTITLSGKPMFEGTGGKDVVISNFKIAGADVELPKYYGVLTEHTYGGTYKNITNDVNVKIASDESGAIIGYLKNSGTHDTLVIENCVNNGNVNGGNYNKVGTILGTMYKPKNMENVIIKNCVNNGNVSAGGKTGGIVGCVDNPNGVKNVTIENCVNNGSVVGTSGTVGGIVGQVSKATGVETITLKNCTNNGSVTTAAKYNAGGILGMIQETSCSLTLTFDNCVNNADVNAKQSSVGGLLGIVDNTYDNLLTVNINKCVNNGDVTTTDAGDNCGIGGLIGATYNANFALTVTESGNNGDVTNVNKQAAAIIGGYTGDADTATIKITNCYNTGAITAAGNTAAALVSWDNAKAINAASTIEIKNSYSTVANLELAYFNESVAGSFPTKTVTGSSVVTLAKIVEELNKVVSGGKYYAKDGNVLLCTAHDYVSGACKYCGAADPNASNPNPKPAPTGDMTVALVAVAIVSLCGAFVAKKKITE